MTRSHKYNDKEHTADGVVMHHENIPKFFGKNGFADADPKKIKKNGGGKANWYATFSFVSHSTSLYIKGIH